MAEGPPQVPLRVEFLQGQKKYMELTNSNLNCSEPAFLSLLEEALRHFWRCKNLVQQLSIFSSNETVEDVNTTDLKYVLVPWYLGDLAGRLQGPKRMEHLKQSKALLQEFIDRCEKLELVGEDLHKIFTREGTADPATRRQEKIDQYKREKVLADKLKDVIARQEAKSRSRMGRTAEDEDDEDELDREHILLLVDDGLNQCLTLLPLIDQELQMIAMRPPPGSEPPRPPSPPKPKPGQKGPSFTTITMSKEEIRDAVFAMRNQPTMSLEEFGEMQMKEAIEREKKQKAVAEARAKAEAPAGRDERGSEALDDAATYKAREWDAYVESVPKGSGVTKKY